MKTLLIKNEYVDMEFEDVYEEFQGMVFQYAYKFSKDYAWSKVELDDLVQVGNIALWETYEQYDSDTYKTHFSTLLHYKLLEHLQREVRKYAQDISNGELQYNVEHFDSAEVCMPTYEDDCTGMIAEEMLSSIKYILNDEEMRFIELVNNDEYTMQEIADIKNCSRQWLYQYWDKVKDKVQKALKEEGYDIHR